MKIVLMGGSLRPGSLNTRYLRYLAKEVESQGHNVVVFAGQDLRWPLYEDDVVAPESARTLADAMRGAAGLIVVSPEYNAGIPGHLKNAVDWLSTLQPSPWTGLPVLLCACSPGAFGGSRGMLSWRATLANMGALAVPQALPIPHADKNLDEAGRPVEERTVQMTHQVVEAFLTLCARVAH
jgi:chromate reductase